jgi:hypothetical protein
MNSPSESTMQAIKKTAAIERRPNQPKTMVKNMVAKTRTIMSISPQHRTDPARVTASRCARGRTANGSAAIAVTAAR